MHRVNRVSKSRRWLSRDYVHFGIGLTVLILVGAFFSYALHPANTGCIDPAGCRCGQPPTSQTIVFVDNTDPFSPGQVRLFQDRLGEVHNRVRPWGMLTVAGISGALPARIIFSRCSPEKGEIPSFFESIRHSGDDWLELKKDYEDQFQRPVNELTARMPLNQTTRFSPIIGSIKNVINQLGEGWKRARVRNVFIFSDLLENTEAFSQYRSRDVSQSFKRVRAAIPYIRDADLDLHKVEVTVFYLTGRKETRGLQDKPHEDFWRDLVRFYGGDVREWLVVPAAAGQTIGRNEEDRSQ